VLHLPLCFKPQETHRVHHPDKTNSKLCTECFNEIKVFCGNVHGILTWCQTCFSEKPTSEYYISSGTIACQGHCNNNKFPLYRGICKPCRFGGLYEFKYKCQSENIEKKKCGYEQKIYAAIFLDMNDVTGDTSQYIWLCE